MRAPDLSYDGIRGLVVQALGEPAKVFYEHLGFDPAPLDPMTLMITLADLRASLSPAPIALRSP